MQFDFIKLPTMIMKMSLLCIHDKIVGFFIA